jgi:hypothetical protein
MSYSGPGEYEHYKGGKYRVYGLGLHESELYQVVVYEPLTPGSKLDGSPIKFWIRPLENFNQDIPVENEPEIVSLKPRFRKLIKSLGE